MSYVRRGSSLLALLLISSGAPGTQTQTRSTLQSPQAIRRDPTQPPAILAAPVGIARLPGNTFRPEHLVTVAGVRYLVWNSRRYAVGETIQGARIERITDGEVWLRGNDGLRKLPLFTGIEKRSPNSMPPATKPRLAATDGKNGLIK